MSAISSTFIAQTGGDLLGTATPIEAFAAHVQAMERTLADDFASGRIGKRYNTYAHRSRMVRQEKARLEAMRQSIRIAPVF
ncbi:hypothetical protein ABIC78_002835 [Novosphingobium sp. 1529]|uniref:hypothetical protein n=1 Tax=Novosphingobium sp. 1529 TaxID=3156424 RepID=UPI00145B7C43